MYETQTTKTTNLNTSTPLRQPTATVIIQGRLHFVLSKPVITAARMSQMVGMKARSGKKESMQLA